MYKLKQNKAPKSSKFQRVSNSNKHNPLDKNVKVSRCVICDSKMNWADKCPYKSNYQSVNISEEVSSDTENESESEEINIVLMTEEIDLSNEIFIAETSKLAVEDTENGKIIIFDKKIDLYFSTSENYCIDIYTRNGELNNYEEVMILEKNLSDNERKSQVIKIHK